MQIRLLKLGHSARALDIPGAAAIGDTLGQTDLAHEGHSIAANGLGTGLTTALSDGAVLTLVPNVEGGVG